MSVVTNQRIGTRPDDGLVMLIEEVLSFDCGYPKVVERAFERQPDLVKVAIRKHWLVDHLPTYAVMIDLALTDFEAELAHQFWADLLAYAKQHPRRRRHRQEAIA